MTKSKPYTKVGSQERAVLIEWVGPMNRKNIIHLNEHGYTRDGKNIHQEVLELLQKH